MANNNSNLIQNLDKIIAEHREITNCIEARDERKAELLAHDHTRLFQSRCLQYLQDIGTAEVRVSGALPALTLPPVTPCSWIALRNPFASG